MHGARSQPYFRSGTKARITLGGRLPTWPGQRLMARSVTPVVVDVPAAASAGLRARPSRRAPGARRRGRRLRLARTPSPAPVRGVPRVRGGGSASLVERRGVRAPRSAVVGVTWFEASSYASWLSARSAARGVCRRKRSGSARRGAASTRRRRRGETPCRPARCPTDRCAHPGRPGAGPRTRSACAT